MKTDSTDRMLRDRARVEETVDSILLRVGSGLFLVGIIAIVIVLLLFWPRNASASPITYDYVRTGGQSVTGHVTIDGSSSNFPSLHLNCFNAECNYVEQGVPITNACLSYPAWCYITPNFGNLVDFSFSMAGSSNVTMGFLSLVGPYERWEVAPGRVSFIGDDGDLQFGLSIDTTTGAGSVSFAFAGSGSCWAQTCTSTGTWVPEVGSDVSATSVPEPASLVLLASGLAAVARQLKRRIA
jgi:hypothetical protein